MNHFLHVVFVACILAFSHYTNLFFSPCCCFAYRLSRMEGLKTKIFTLGCTQRRSALKNLKTERLKKFDYCMPCKLSWVYFL
ncbi:hypothetical protein SEVIR_2G427000v4 [Setaria viridis]|uniref:Secreted protein n=1 Tax=Setaria viridis TaxID=4556 RepID=A0A4U6W4E6_SETVI|nr:hypothetical protein SEVIR_2G427000v2 [Setaria viridis]